MTTPAFLLRAQTSHFQGLSVEPEQTGASLRLESSRTPRAAFWVSCSLELQGATGACCEWLGGSATPDPRVCQLQVLVPPESDRTEESCGWQAGQQGRQLCGACHGREPPRGFLLELFTGRLAVGTGEHTAQCPEHLRGWLTS